MHICCFKLLYTLPRCHVREPCLRCNYTRCLPTVVLLVTTCLEILSSTKVKGVRRDTSEVTKKRSRRLRTTPQTLSKSQSSRSRKRRTQRASAIGRTHAVAKVATLNICRRSSWPISANRTASVTTTLSVPETPALLSTGIRTHREKKMTRNPAATLYQKIHFQHYLLHPKVAVEMDNPTWNQTLRQLAREDSQRK